LSAVQYYKSDYLHLDETLELSTLSLYCRICNSQKLISILSRW